MDYIIGLIIKLGTAAVVGILFGCYLTCMQHGDEIHYELYVSHPTTL